MISRIDGSGPLVGSQSLRRTSKSGASKSSGFSEHLDDADETEASSAAQDASPLGTVSGVLDIQEVDDALARASRGKMRAEDILDKLDELRLSLLDGQISKEELLELSRVVNSRKIDVSDPKLASILDEIDLRAQVELAKFTSLPA